MSTPQWPSAEPGGQPQQQPWSSPDPPAPDPSTRPTGSDGEHASLPGGSYAPPSTLPPGSTPADWSPPAAATVAPAWHAAPPDTPDAAWGPPGAGPVAPAWNPYAAPAPGNGGPPPVGQVGDVAVVPQPPPHRWGFGAFLLAELVFLLASIVVPVVAVLPYGLGDGDPLPGPALVAALALPPIIAALVALYATTRRGNGPVVDLRLRFDRRDVGIGVACGVLGVAATIPLGYLWAGWVGEDDATSAVGEIFDGLQLPVVLAVLVFLHIWLVAPLCEEIIFRGLLWGAMEKREWNRWLILAITTVVFSLAHFELQRAPLLLGIALPIGIARLLSGRLAAPVIAHQINNFLPAVALTALLLGYSFE